MYFSILKNNREIYCLNRDNFSIAKITTIEKIDNEIENKILDYLNSKEVKMDYQKIDNLLSGEYELSIGLISNCNLNCLYCYGQQKKNIKLDLNKIEETFISLNKTDFRVQFVGAGEALLDFAYFKEAVKIIKKYTKNIWLVTNGTLLSKEVIEFLVTESINVTISMDGGNEQFHNKYRKDFNGNGSYGLIINNFRNLCIYEKENNKYITKWVSAVITDYNKDLISLFNSFNEIPADLIMFRFYMGKEKEFCLSNNNEFEKNIIAYISFIFQKIIINDKKAYRVINHRDNVFKYLIRLLNKDISIERCGAGRIKSSLYTDGKLYLCDYCSGMKDLSLVSFDMHEKKDKKCSECNYVTLCGGYCKYENYIGNNYTCVIVPIIVNQLVIELAELQIQKPYIYEKLKNYCKRIALFL